MTATTVLATRHGSIRPAVEAVVAERELSVANVLAVDGDEDNQYHLPPALVDQLVDCVDRTEPQRVVVDGLLHAGQMYDLSHALPAVELLDRRDLYYEHLAEGGNPAAETARELRRRQIELRTERRRQRDGATTGPTGESGSVSELSDACDRLTASLESCQQRQRHQIKTSYEGVDARVVVVGPVGAPTTDGWCALTGERAESTVLRPATPRTAVADIGPHEVAVTDTPGFVAGQPEWFTAAVPGTMAAVERADILVVVESANHRPSLAIDDTAFGGTVVWTQPPADGERASWRSQFRKEIAQALPTVRLTLTLPYGAESVLSRLYDETTVESVAYGEEIEADVAVPAGRSDRIEQAVEQAGGTVECSE